VGSKSPVLYTALRLLSIDRSSTSVSAIWRQRDRCESSMNFQPAGKVCLFSMTAPKGC
jgi:hypothetical protein